MINFVHAGVWGVLGPVIAEDTIGAASWGLVLSAIAAGFLVSSVVMYRVTFTHLLGVGQAFLVLGGAPAGAARPRRARPRCSWSARSSAARARASTASPTRRRSRSTSPGSRCPASASIDSMASLVTVPLGQLAVIPVAAAFGDAQVAVVGGLVFAVVAAGMLAVRPSATPPEAVRRAILSAGTERFRWRGARGGGTQGRWSRPRRRSRARGGRRRHRRRRRGTPRPPGLGGVRHGGRGRRRGGDRRRGDVRLDRPRGGPRGAGLLAVRPAGGLGPAGTTPSTRR